MGGSDAPTMSQRRLPGQAVRLDLSYNRLLAMAQDIV